MRQYSLFTPGGVIEINETSVKQAIVGFGTELNQTEGIFGQTIFSGMAIYRSMLF